MNAPSLRDYVRFVTIEQLGPTATDADLAAYRQVFTRAWQESPPLSDDEAKRLEQRVLEGKHGEWVQS